MLKIAGILALAVLTACGRGSPAVGAAPVARAGDSVWVAIDNRNFYDAHIYAEFEGHNERRLGLVSGFGKDTFALVWRNNQLRMRSRLVGVEGGRVISNKLFVEPGDLLELIIQPQAHR